MAELDERGSDMKATRGRTRTPRLRAAAALVVLFAAGPLGAQAQKPTGPAAEVETTLRATMDAWSTLDPTKAASFYAKDPGLVFFDLTPLKYVGWSEYEAGTKEVFATFAALKMTPGQDLTVHPAGNWAWATATVKADVTMKGAATPMSLEARWTTILEKRAGKWTIVHEHLSTPMEVPAMPAAPAKH